jgi:NAD(P)-dependent dehydrogenase (short-subunit alcohol dehydrogenase family)
LQLPPHPGFSRSAASLQAIAYGSAYMVSKTALVRFSENLAQETAEHGIGVFAVDPGTVRTAMTEYLLESAEGQRWLPWCRGIFEEGHDVAAERVAQLAVTLAGGQADVLSGRFLSVEDDIATLVEQAAVIDRDGAVHPAPAPVVAVQSWMGSRSA